MSVGSEKVMTSKTASSQTETYAVQAETYTVRVPSNGYVSAIFLMLFATAFLIYLEKDFLSLLLLAVSFFIIPLFLITDKLVFDGEKIYRTEAFPRLWAKLNNQKLALKIQEIQQVETYAFRTLKSGGTIFYRYRTVIRGRNATFVLISSNNKSYRRFFRALISTLPEAALDLKTIELRDFLVDPSRIKTEAERLGLPSDDFLENSIKQVLREETYKRQFRKLEPVMVEAVKVERLRRVGNQLKIAGHLLQALEAFRRSLFLKPTDARLIFDYARCLYSFADSERNQKLKMRAIAALRLTEMRSNNDFELLLFVAEAYFQYGYLRNARKVFQKVLDLTHENFRAACGLAEIALREGKLKQVIHYFSMASRFAKEQALKDWAEREANYLNLFNNILVGKKIALKFALIGFLTIIFGVFTSEWLIDVGWTISALSLLSWLGFSISNSFLSERTP